jgi:hypothetical protein
VKEKELALELKNYKKNKYFRKIIINYSMKITLLNFAKILVEIVYYPFVSDYILLHEIVQVEFFVFLVVIVDFEVIDLVLEIEMMIFVVVRLVWVFSLLFSFAQHVMII